MGTAYKIKCKHCGTEFQHSASACYGLYQECVGCGSSVVETDIPIRLRACTCSTAPSRSSTNRWKSS